MYCSKSERIKLILSARLIEAGADFLYLLERGYSRKSALDLVTARWGLDRLERLALYRGVFDTLTSYNRILKFCKQPKKLAIDGFNVISTIYSAIVGDNLILATDGFIRDLSATIRKVKVTPLFITALVIVLNYVSRFEIMDLIVVFDAQVSRSGELVKLAREMAKAMGVSGTFITSGRTDSLLAALSAEYTLATSDSLLIDRSKSVLDLGGIVSCAVAEENIINLKSLIEKRVNELAEAFTERVGTYDEKARNESQTSRMRESNPNAT